MQLLEIPAIAVNLIALAIPIISICIFILIIPWLRNSSGKRMRRYLSYLINPPKIGSMVFDKEDELHHQISQWREIKVRLFFIYLGIALFLISFTIGEFYEVFIDLLLPVTQGNTGEMRIVTSVILTSPFSVGWIGSMPWYGGLPAPSSFGTYHETWSWIFATAAVTDNPSFLGTVVTALLLFSSGVGLVFLLPLASKTIRRSFLPSMFFFTTGMVTFTKAAMGCFGQVLALAVGGSVRYGIMTATASMIPDFIEVIAWGIPTVLVLFAVFAALGRKLWKVHYSDSTSRKWFLMYVTLTYWIGLALTIIVA